MYLLGVGIFLVSAYFSGNLLNASSTIIPLSFIIGLALNEYNKKIPSEKILGFIGFFAKITLNQRFLNFR